MKYHHEKVVLKSQVFKNKPSLGTTSRSQSKSPAHTTNRLSQDPARIDPSQLFQKVCCPNCRYLFKIIKNQQLLEDKKKQIMQTLNKEIQTEEKYLTEIKKEIKEMENYSQATPRNLNIQINELLTPKQSNISNINLYSEFEKQMKASTENQKHLKASTYKFENLTPEPSERRSLEENKHPSRSTSQLQRLRKRNQKIQFKQQFQNASSSRVVDEQLVKELKQHLVREYEIKKQLQLIGQFCNDLPSTLEIPAFYKMIFKSS